MDIWQELKRRKVLKVAGAYVVIAWVMIQVAATLEDTLELPGWFDKLVFAVLVLGFPLALLLSWVFEINREEHAEGAAPRMQWPVYAVLMIVLAIAGAGLALNFGDRTDQIRAISVSPAIAVLPFTDLSPEGDQSWFADGIAEEILNVLAQTEGIKVASRTASFRFRDETPDLQAIADALQVNTILEGSVRSTGSRLRITAQLISAADGFHLWSDTYDRDLNDVFAVQDEIAVSIATALFGELGITSLPADRFKDTESVAAYEHYLRGLEKINGFNRTAAREAVSDFRRALDLDRGYADAWVGLARAESLENRYQNLRPGVSPSLQRALQLSPEDADAVVELALVNYEMLRWVEAEQLFRRAKQLEPDNARVRESYGDFLRTTGRVRAALAEFRRAWELGSEHFELRSLIVNTHAYLGEFAQAREFWEAELAKAGPANVRASVQGAEAYFVSLLADGMEDDARRFAEKYNARFDDTSRATSLSLIRIQFFLRRMEDPAAAADELVRATHERIDKTGFPRSGDIENFLMAGRPELARENFDKIWGYQWGAPRRFYLYVSDEIDPRYLEYRPNILLIADEFPEVGKAFRSIGIDVVAMAREKGFLE